MIAHAFHMLRSQSGAALLLSGVLMLGACNGGGGGGGIVVFTPVDGSHLYVGGVSGRVLVYSDANGVSGSTAPNRIVAGGLTTLNGPRGLAVDMPRNQLYVANYLNNSILVFHNARTVTGGDAPNRTISSASLNRPSAVFVDSVNNRLYVANTGGHSILIYDNASSRNGVTAPDRILSGANTNLSGPIGIFVDITRNLLYVVNADNKVLVFTNASTASGNTAPTRTISGLSGVGGIFVDVLNDRLYLVASGANVVLVFDGASGLIGSPPPNRALAGPATQLNQPRDLFVDLGTDRLYVTNAGSNAVLVFNAATTVSGNSAPNRVLTLTAATDPWGIFVDVTPLTIGSTAELDGFIENENGSFTATAASGSPRTGDNDSFIISRQSRQFFSFNLANIPSSVTLEAATLRLYQASVTGTPFNDLGTIELDHVNYGNSLDANNDDYASGSLALLGVISSDATVGYRSRDVKTRVSEDLTAARIRSQYRVRFAPIESNTDGGPDYVQFTDSEDSCCTVSRPPQLVLILKP